VRTGGTYSYFENIEYRNGFVRQEVIFSNINENALKGFSFRAK
jgi:hypothetical protein